MNTSRVAVIIPCRNELNYIEACVQSVLDQDYPADRLHVYVVDGQSDDGTRQLIEQEFEANSRVHVLDNPNRTTPYALNIGIQHADADVSIIFGAHAVMQPYYVSGCVALLHEDPRAGCVGGMIENVNENTVAGYISQCMSSSFGVGNAHFRTGNGSGYVDTVAFGAYRREVFEQVGYFDEALTRNQDDEFNYRVKKGGWEIVLDPEVRSKYFVRGSYGKLARQYYQYGYWKVYVNVLHATVTTIRQLIPFAFVAYLFGATLLTGLWPSLLALWWSPLLVYGVLSFAISIQMDRSVQGIFMRMWVFFLLHCSYGWGYWRGIAQFVVFGRNPGQHASRTSR